MILFITAQDAATSDNFIVAGHLMATAATALCGPTATRAPLLAALEANGDQPFLAFSHGEPREIRGHDDNLGIGEGDIALLINRRTYAHACHTGESLGPLVAGAGGIWFGYAGPVNALPSDPDTINLFREIVDFIAQHFPECDSPALAQAFMDDLSALTDVGFDTVCATASLEQLHTFRDISRRLRIWLPGVPEPIKHPEAFGDPVL
ncbi:hypothetical protein [Sphingomonas crocodyli]|uniref:Uncharacterized protein n=1 Tax=Sphingomonas crocodyli TaxID=1979270 RepID=A0A437M6F0_9SPHN|nr:hypothetical protein [Sphingomonas crocodyli]RVT93135.1 hypothetical protein EOD43_04365 [Sphingomonas crocodyli]